MVISFPSVRMRMSEKKNATMKKKTEHEEEEEVEDIETRNKSPDTSFVLIIIMNSISKRLD